jgi:hypothetical protein
LEPQCDDIVAMSVMEETPLRSGLNGLLGVIHRCESRKCLFRGE